MKTFAPFAGLALVFLFLPASLFAAWPQNGVAVGAAANNQNAPVAVPDGAGGAIIVWEDNRTGTYQVYAQRVDAVGVPQWTPDGVVVTSGSSGSQPQILADGAGGVIIAYFRNQDIYAQRINSAGASVWTAGGVAICAATGGQSTPTLASDNAGGAIVAWNDGRNGVDNDIYVRRVTALGVPQWTLDGAPVSVFTGPQNDPQITADGSGGAVLTWTDWRTGAADIYVQRINSLGVAQWAANGVGLCTATDFQGDPAIVSDGSGGAIVAWEDSRNLNLDTFARRVNSAGVPQWTANGVALAVFTNAQANPVLIPDGLGGAIIAWDDGRNSLGQEVYAQRLNLAGAALWTASGVALATTNGGNEPSIVTDGLGGAIIGWWDNRSGTKDIYARRINGSGVPQWTANGTALCTAAGNQDATQLVSDGVGGAFVVWEDERVLAGSNDVYAQRIERNGYWGYPSPEIVMALDIPADQGGQINLSWNASRLDPWPDELIDNYTVWRAIDPVAAASAIAAGASVMKDGDAVLPASGREIIRVQEINETTYFWKLMSTLVAFGLSGYSEVVPTLFDSPAPEFHYFQVIAHAGSMQWISGVASAQSFDNLAPLPPLALSAQRVGADVHLVWNQNEELDLDHYAVYRHTATGVTPIPTYFLSAPEDTVMIDANAPTGSLYYIVTAIDAHTNQSPQSNEAGVSPVTAVGDTPKSYVLSVSNYPNPFNPRTTVSYTVPSRGPVTISIYDANGARVATLFKGERAPGAYSVSWDGRTDDAASAASGVYFVRIEHSSGTRTKKMVLLK